MLLLLLACGAPPPALPSDPISVSDQVAMQLTEAAILRQQGDETSAVAAWERALDAFDQALAARLRTRCGDRCTAELEYGFARVRHAIDTDDREAVVIADALGVRIQKAAATLPPLEGPP